MRKLNFTLLTLAFLFIATNLWAQTSGSYRFTYEFVFQKDTNDVHSKTKELYFLDVFKDHSSFVGANKLRMDKVMDSMGRVFESRFGSNGGMAVNMMRTNAPSTGYVIYKFPDGTMEYQSAIGGVLYAYNEDMNLDWDISDSTTTYSNYNCQIATTAYGGRKWKAWFTMDIPVQNGPYKFMGLPGLIVKIEDDKNQCLFELTEVGTIDITESPIPKAEKINKANLVKMTENALSKPISAMMGSLPAGANINMANIRDQNGNPISLEDIEKRRQEALRKNNNRIELN